MPEEAVEAVEADTSVGRLSDQTSQMGSQTVTTHFGVMASDGRRGHFGGHGRTERSGGLQAGGYPASSTLSRPRPREAARGQRVGVQLVGCLLTAWRAQWCSWIGWGESLVEQYLLPCERSALWRICQLGHASPFTFLVACLSSQRKGIIPLCPQPIP